MTNPESSPSLPQSSPPAVTEAPRNLPELVEHAKDVLARGYIDSEGFARALVSLYESRSSSPSASEITEAPMKDEEIMEVLKVPFTFDPKRGLDQILPRNFFELVDTFDEDDYSVALYKLEQLFREQQEEIERLRQTLHEAIEDAQQTFEESPQGQELIRFRLSSLKDSQLTETERALMFRVCDEIIRECAQGSISRGPLPGLMELREKLRSSTPEK